MLMSGNDESKGKGKIEGAFLSRERSIVQAQVRVLKEEIESVTREEKKKVSERSILPTEIHIGVSLAILCTEARSGTMSGAPEDRHPRTT